VASDASGPLFAEADVAAGRIGVPVRSNSIGMSLVRDRQYQSLWTLQETGTVSRVVWVHLAQGVEGGATVDWIDCDSPTATHKNYAPPRELIDERVSAMRTDLDSFSDAEAYVLMTSGYRMIERAFRGARPGEPTPSATPWSFLAVEPIMNKERGYERAHGRLLKLLGASNRTLFKLRWIVPGLTPIFIAAALGALYWALVHPGSLPGIPVRWIAVATIAVLATAAVLSQMRRWVRTQVSLGGVLITLLALVIWIPARLHLHVLDPLFLRLGKIDRLRPDRAGRLAKRPRTRR
jgi:hypothetical protein